jgi:hypothetical protein
MALMSIFAARLSIALTPRKIKKICSDIKSVLQRRSSTMMILGGEFSVTLEEDFFFSLSPPQPHPHSLNISLYVCLSPDEGAASRADAFVLPECLSRRCELFHGLAEQRFI